MKTQTVRVPQWAFYGDSELELRFPDHWDVELLSMPGADFAPLTDDALRARLANPIGTASLCELARGKKQAVIVFDDIARPTPIDRIWPCIVDELNAAGIRDSQIRFVVALGTHGAHSRDQFRRKLGGEALRRFPVYNHDISRRCTLVGTTSRGTPVEINDEVLACDLRIAIGSVLPHPSMGFGGGPKIVLPGIASHRSIEHHHIGLSGLLNEQGYSASMRAGVAENENWRDIAEAGAMAGIDYCANALLNQRRQVVDLVAGDLIKAWRAGVRLARGIYATRPPIGADIVVANAYGKGNEAQIAAKVPLLGYGAGPEGRTVVAINNSPQGVVVHYLLGDWGNAARGDDMPPRVLPKGVSRMVVYEPSPELASRRFFAAGGGEQCFEDTWDGVLERLTRWHPNGAKVAVYPDLTVQYIEASGCGE